MIVLALTGSVGMGKSTTASMFADMGVPVHDADATVHRLYAGEAIPVIADLFPGAVSDGVVDRAALGAIVLSDDKAMKRLESAIHPMVRQAEREFLDTARARGDDLVILDIPLLFETGGEKRVDGVVVATCDPAEQRRRVLARPGMTEEKFEAILSRQVPDKVKRGKADFLVVTDHGMKDARRQVAAIVEAVRTGSWLRPG
ncbi:MAG: dephospho-CoA kinase [Pseudomonadota bacterium]|nr:dephospho-CoA kinase [Pseudomonadota bacterium]